MIKNLILYLLLFFPVIFLSQNTEKEYVYTDQILQPGSTTSVSFRIDNKSTVEKTYKLEVETTNENIQPIVSTNEVTIAPGKSFVYIIPIKVLSDTPKGTYLFYLHIKDPETANTYTKYSPLVVSRKRKLTLTKGDTPEYIKAGDEITSTVIAKNSGNMAERLFLSTEKNTSIKGDSVVTILPGESKVITIIKKTDQRLGSVEYQNIYLTAITENHPIEKLSVYNNVKVIPIKPIEEDAYHRLPVFASVVYIGQRNGGIFKDGFQGEISGIGSLRKNSSDIFQFRAISKNPIEFSAFTPYEEYFVSYKSDKFYAHLGDKSYSASILTEFARYGRGAELNYKFKKLTVGGFYNHPRFFRDIKDEYSVYSSYQFNPTTEVKAGYLYKIPESEKKGFETHLPYITGKTKVFKNIDAQREVAFSKNDFSQGFAYMGQAQGTFEKLTAGLIYLKASPSFSGYFTNTNSITANLQYRVYEKLSVVGNYRQDATNFKRDTLLGVAPYQKYLQSGIEFKYTSKGKLLLMGGFQRYQDRMEFKRFDYNESFVRANISQQLGIFTLAAEAQFGKTHNILNNITGQSQQYSLNLAFEKFNTSFNFYGSYAENTRYIDQNQKQFYYGARVMSRFSRNNSLSIFYQNNYTPEDYYTDRNLFEVMYRQQIFRNQFIDLSGRYTLQRAQLGNKDFIVSLKYTLQINAPVQKTAEYVTLSGNIANLGVDKVDGIRLFLGSYIAVTDKNGDYIFKNVVPKDYTLEIDRSTLGLNNITDVRMPLDLHLTNKQNFLNFGVTNAGLVQGEVNLNQGMNESSVSFAQLSLNKEKKKSESIVLEAAQGDQIFRKIVTVGEKFDFTYLRPGDWKVKIYREGLDKRYKIISDTFEFTLKPGETKNIPINIIKQQKEVKYQQETIRVSYNDKKR